MTDDVNAIACAGCSASLEPGAAFCARCGRPVGPEPVRRSSSFGSFLGREESRRLKRASNWLLILALMFVVFGTIFGLHNRSQAEQARVQLAQFSDDQQLTVENHTYTVAELRKKIDREVYLLFGLNYFLAVVMLGLHVWSRRSPFPAMLTGLCVYLAVIALDAIVDPKTLFQGVLIKVIFIGAMIAGIKAALQERDRRRAEGPPADLPAPLSS